MERTQYDLAQLVHGLKLNRQLAKTKPLANKIKYELIDTTIPHPPESDEYLTYGRLGGARPASNGASGH